MPQYTEDNMAHAIADIANGKLKKSAVKEWGVINLPYSLLRIE